MHRAWLICLGLLSCDWSAAVDSYCERSGECASGGGTSAVGGNGNTGGGASATGGGSAGGLSGGGSGTAGGAGGGSDTAGGAGGGSGNAGGGSDTAGGGSDTAGGGSGAGGAGGGSSAGGAGGGSSAGGTAGGAGDVGAPCTVAADCANGRCVDGYCCDGLCNNPCDVCNFGGHEGACLPAPLGNEPSSSCPGYFACDGMHTGCASACTSDAGCLNARCADGLACIPKLERLKEDFNAGFDQDLWAAEDATCSVVNGQFDVTTVPNSTTYPAIFSRYRYDLTDSEVRIELVSAGNQSLALDAQASICDYPSANQCLNLIAEGNRIGLELGNNGVFTYPWGLHPLGNIHLLRIRESAGVIYLEAGNDAGVYQVLGQAMTSSVPRQVWMDVTYDIGAGTYLPQSQATTVIWDNVNTP